MKTHIVPMISIMNQIADETISTKCRYIMDGIEYKWDSKHWQFISVARNISYKAIVSLADLNVPVTVIEQEEDSNG